MESVSHLALKQRISAHAHQHMPMHMRKEFHHRFTFNPRQLTPEKMAVLAVKMNFLNIFFK